MEKIFPPTFSLKSQSITYESYYKFNFVNALFVKFSQYFTLYGIVWRTEKLFKILNNHYKIIIGNGILL